MGFIEQTTDELHHSWRRVLAGGIVATVAITVMMYGVAPVMLGGPMDIAADLASMAGGIWAVGLVMHFVLGTVVFPIGYLVVMHRRRVAPWASGLIWGVVLWLAAMVVVMPIVGKPPFIGAMNAALASLIGHLIYGAVLGLIIGRPIGRARVHA